MREKENFKFKEWRKERISFSNKWQASLEPYPVAAEGDALAISKALYDKYFGQRNRKRNKYHFEISGRRVLRFTHWRPTDYTCHFSATYLGNSLWSQRWRKDDVNCKIIGHVLDNLFSGSNLTLNPTKFWGLVIDSHCHLFL